MICKKCGQHYEDDMLKCLWCDAPNENYVAPEKELRKLAKNTQQQSQNIPQGNSCGVRSFWDLDISATT